MGPFGTRRQTPGNETWQIVGGVIGKKSCKCRFFGYAARISLARPVPTLTVAPTCSDHDEIDRLSLAHLRRRPSRIRSRITKLLSIFASRVGKSVSGRVLDVGPCRHGLQGYSAVTRKC